MRHRAGEFGQAIESADSPEAAAVAVAALAADYDPGTASDLISAVLSSSAANAILSAD
jgi:hypothetical protein